MSESNELRMTRLIFVGSFLVSALVLASLALNRPIRANIAASYLWTALLVLGTMTVSACTGARRRFLRLFLLLSILNLIVVPAEAYLRLRGFHYESGIQFGYPRPSQFSAFEPHEKLFWRFSPSQPGVNSYGFRGREVRTPKPALAYRILYIGNSCTYQGFPGMVEMILRGRRPETECLNFATPGYTSFQGKVVVQSYVDGLEPDLAVVSFGWNDRWLAYGSTDEEKRIVIPAGGFAKGLRAVYSRWRTLQFMRKFVTPARRRAVPLDVSRVPADRFRANLRVIGEEFSRRGIPVIFVTEPSSHHSLGVPEYVVRSHYAVSKEASLALLAEYNGIVREVAGERPGWFLIDLDSLISGRRDVRGIFTGDGLHFSERGLALVAEIESRFISTNIFVDRRER